MSENPPVKTYEYAGMRAYERMRLSRAELIRECANLKKTLPFEEASIRIDRKITEWMQKEEGAGRYALVADLVPRSPTHTRGDRLFLGTDSASLIISEPNGYNNFKYVAADVGEPIRATVFLDPNEARRMMRITQQMSSFDKLFFTEWWTAPAESGMTPFQFDPLELGVKIERDKVRSVVKLVPNKFRPIDDRDLMIQHVRLSRQQVQTIHQPIKSRQNTKAA